MANTPKTIFDQLHLASVTDGDWRIDQLEGLGRLTPFLFIGSNRLPDVTVRGYYNCSWLAHFRVAVRGMIQDPGVPTWQKPGSTAPPSCPALFDLDTRILYFGQKDQNPNKTDIKILSEGKPGGGAIFGAPMRIRQINFRAFKPQDESDEYSAWFLATNPVAKKQAYGSRGCSSPSILIDSDFAIERAGDEYQWTYNNWTLDGSESTAVEDFEARLVMGDPLVSEALEVSPGTWDGMMYDHYSDLCPNPKNNTFKLSVDKNTLIVRQECPSETEPGWHYRNPFDIIISNRYKFEKGDKEGGDTTCVPKNWTASYDPDHFDIKYYDECEKYHEDKLLRRPDPTDFTPGDGYSAQAIGSYDNTSWQPIPVLQLPDFCKERITPDDCTVLVSVKKCDPGGDACATEIQNVTVGDINDRALCKLADLLPRIVTSVYSTGCEIKYTYVDLSCVDGKLVCSAGREEVIGFTNCDGSPCEPSGEPSLASCAASGTSCSFDGEKWVQKTPDAETTCIPRSPDSCDPTEVADRDPGEEGCPRTACPQVDPN